MDVDVGPKARHMLAGAGLAFAAVMFVMGAWLLCRGLSGVSSFADDDGREHEATVDANAASEREGRLRVGETVTVSYDPERSEESVTVSGEGLWARAFPGIACFVVSVAVAVSSASFACGGGNGRGGVHAL